MRPTLFISDLHLCDARPTINEIFFRFLTEVAADARALYILGDLFEYWVGDDQLDHDPLARRICDALATVNAKGVKVYFMHGNRDFLISTRFAIEARITILDDPTEIDLDGTRVLLMHGDTLCTDDVAYQKFRQLTRSLQWQFDTLRKTYAERTALAGSIRTQSDSAKVAKAAEIMDVTKATVEETFRHHDYPRLIHGHTHRPAHHQHRVDGRRCDRWVLPDWHKCGGYLTSPTVPGASFLAQEFD
jgi:UDP-2,3-diacylglucosamine hydrolase